MYFYKAYISYDGTNFSGFQKQVKQRTIQGEIEKSLFKLNKEKSSIFYAGRTDSKVHAIENVISFGLKNNFTSEKLLKILNSLFPDDIRVNKVYKTSLLSNPRFEAKKRVYTYVIYKHYPLPPFLTYHTIELNKFVKSYTDFDLKVFNEILFNFTGYHNFNAFTTTKEKRNTYRTLYCLFIKEIGNFFFIYISGKSFLHKMVRAIIGASFEIYNKNINIDLLKKSLKSGEKLFTYTVAPPFPLYLKKIIF